MAFTGDFSVTQGLDPSAFSVQDISVGSDVNITGRQITLIKADGTYLVPDGVLTSYVLWPLNAGNTYNFTNFLKKDYSILVQVDWLIATNLKVSGNVYTKSKLVTFTGYLEGFDYSLIQELSAKPDIINDTVFINNLLKLRVDIDSANSAGIGASDQFNAQYCLDMGTYLKTYASQNF